MNFDEKENNIYFILKILNVNVIYYVNSNPDILEYICNNPILLKLLIGQYEYFMNIYNQEIINIEYNLTSMEENIIDMKKILENLQHTFKDYLINYDLDTYENTVNWKKKIETIVENLDIYNLSEENENKILELIETIISADNENCEKYFFEIDEILGFNL